MGWIKKGLVYGPSGTRKWAMHSALQPTPLVRSDGSIRVFVGFRDGEGIGRVGFVDLAGDDPSNVLRVSEEPVLDIGNPGAFDDNGVIPCAAVQRNDLVYLYYAGYQCVKRVRFIAFSGLAISDDGGETFRRYRQVPVLERSDEGVLFRAIHTIFHDEGVWKVWYGAGTSFIQGKEKTLPVYNIKYMESPDGVTFPDEGIPCVEIEADEHRVGRPYVLKKDGGYEMFFGAGSEQNPYRLCYAYSKDGRNWTRAKNEIRLEGEAAFDSKMSCYPAVVDIEGKRYMFYNGNDYGKEGFGYAEFLP